MSTREPALRPEVAVPPRAQWMQLSAGEALDAAWDALRCVYDPELCLDVVSLGLVYDVRDDDGTLVVEMTLTTPGCPASESLPEMARLAVTDAVDGAVAVDVRVVWEPPWSPEMMDDAAAGALGFRTR
ncbi:MAG: metal-sulfur cluster assembly factor [Acidimicrobiales bacterium]